MGLSKKVDWVVMNWVSQLLFFIVIGATLIINMMNDSIRTSGWIFMAAYTFAFAFSSINCLCLHIKKVREIIAIVIILFMIFTVPMTFYSLGGSIEATSGMSLIYVLMSITLSPLLVGLGILICALFYSGFIHYNNFFEQYPVFQEALSKINHTHSKNKVLAVTSEKIGKYFTVKEPATLQQISAYDAVYGNKDYWLAIANANKNIPQNPGVMIPAGTKLAIPAVKGRPYKIKVYTVPRESTLKEISAQKDIYNDESSWRYLYLANKSKVIDTNLTVLGGTKLIVPELPVKSHNKFLIISLIYIAAALVGLCWRILLQELYRLLSIALSATTGQTMRELSEANAKNDTLTADNRRLRKEVAMHIVEIDQIVSYKEISEEQQKS